VLISARARLFLPVLKGSFVRFVFASSSVRPGPGVGSVSVALGFGFPAFSQSHCLAPPVVSSSRNRTKAPPGPCVLFFFSCARVPSAAVGVPVFARSPVHLAFLCCFCLATDAHSIPIARLVSWPPIHSSPCARVRLLIWLHADRFSLRFSSPLAAFTGPRTGIRPDDFESSHPVFLAVVSAWTPGCRLPFFFSRWISSQELPLRRS
jgi:hypothetical protein